MLLSLLLLCLYVACIRILDGDGLTIIRLLRLLRWFVAPIILLHALLSPGQLLWPGFFIAISREGLMQGLNLSIHLTGLFFAAMLMFRLLKRAEWLHYILALPWVGKQLAVYVWMMGYMKANISGLLGDLRLQFQIRKDIKKSPLLLISAFKHALADASEYACLLWLRWPSQMPLLQSIQHPGTDQTQFQFNSISVISISLGCTAFLLAWL